MSAPKKPTRDVGRRRRAAKPSAPAQSIDDVLRSDVPPYWGGGGTWADAEYDERLREARGLNDDADVSGPSTDIPPNGQFGQDTEPKGRNTLVSPYVERAVTNARSSALPAVHAELRKIAVAKEGPFTGEVAEDGGLMYTDSNNRAAKYTREALRAQLRRLSHKR